MISVFVIAVYTSWGSVGTCPRFILCLVAHSHALMCPVDVLVAGSSQSGCGFDLVRSFFLVSLFVDRHACR